MDRFGNRLFLCLINERKSLRVKRKRLGSIGPDPFDLLELEDMLIGKGLLAAQRASNHIDHRGVLKGFHPIVRTVHVEPDCQRPMVGQQNTVGTSVGPHRLGKLALIPARQRCK